MSEIKSCRAVAQLSSSPESVAGSRYLTAKTSIADTAIRKLEEALASDSATHESNASIIAENTSKRDAVLAAVKAAGIPDKYQRRKTTRSAYPKWETRPAGYIEDLAKFCPTDDGWEQSKRRYLELSASFAAWRTKAVEEDERTASAKAAEEARAAERRRKDVAFAAVLVRNGLDEQLGPSDALVALRSTNKRLDLALAMLDTRGDWSDGAYRVSDALGRFTPENEDEVLIKAAVHKALVAFGDDGDGRCFRDCQWNYNDLLATVPEQLKKDAMLVHEMVES